MNLSQVFEDFDRKYQGSYVQVALDGKKPELFRLQRTFTDGSKFPKLELQSDKLGSIVLNYNTSARILFKVPNPTYIQYGKDAYFFRRMAARQWKRGIHQNNSVIQHPLTGVNHRGHDFNLDFTIVRETINPTFTDLYTGIHLIKSGYNSVALSKNMAIVQSPRDKTKMIMFYRLMPIGTVDFDGNINAPGFETEVRNEIK